MFKGLLVCGDYICWIEYESKFYKTYEEAYDDAYNYLNACDELGCIPSRNNIICVEENNSVVWF